MNMKCLVMIGVITAVLCWSSCVEAVRYGSSYRSAYTYRSYSYGGSSYGTSIVSYSSGIITGAVSGGVFLISLIIILVRCYRIRQARRALRERQAHFTSNATGSGVAVSYISSPPGVDQMSPQVQQQAYPQYSSPPVYGNPSYTPQPPAYEGTKATE